MEIHDPGNSQGLRKVLEQICFKQVAFDHAALAWWELADDPKQDRIIPVRDAFHVEDATIAPTCHETGELSEWTFLLEVIGGYLALDQNFRGCGHFEINSC